MNKRKQIYRFAEFNIYYLTKLIIIMMVWYLCWLSYDKIKNVEMLKGFVPHEILQIEADASLSIIKKAFRRLSRLKHPDKNKNNPLAVSEFIEITKAYYVSIFKFHYKGFDFR
jgi:preprotein translocase subunit Sec63